MRKRDTYHHGDLRRALIEAALELVTERGPKGFTLTEVAKRADVSIAAPYRHFTDKSDLLAAVATVSFDQFHAALTEPATTGEGPSLLIELGQRYVRWALDNAAAYQVMFGIDVERGEHPELIEAADRAFEVLLRAARPVATTSRPPLDDAHNLAGALWALGHGIVTLHIGGDLRHARIRTPTNELGAASTAALLAGLAPPSPHLTTRTSPTSRTSATSPTASPTPTTKKRRTESARSSATPGT